MILKLNIQHLLGLQTKRSIKTASSKTFVALDYEISSKNKKHALFDKKHPGKVMINRIVIPDELEASINRVLSDQKMTDLKKQSESFANYLKDRRRPLEVYEIRSLKNKLYARSQPKKGSVPTKEADELDAEVEYNAKAEAHIERPIDFDHRMSILYLAARFMPNYAVAKQLFVEIKKKDPDFRPGRLLDIGSGVGTVMWAADSVWADSLVDYMNHDISQPINSIAELIVKGGSLAQPAKLKGANFKRNMQHSDKNQCDIVACTFTLFEMKDRRERFELVENLWKRVTTNGYLVIAENGNKHGFSLINEIRDYLLNKLNDSQEDTETGHLFAPCPHQLKCPMIKQGQTCRFFSGFKPLDIYDQAPNLKDKVETPYSYVIFKKSPKPEGIKDWPKFVHSNPHVHKGVGQYWLCKPDGTVGHHIAYRSMPKAIRNMIEVSKLGDNFPVQMFEKGHTDETSDTEHTDGSSETEHTDELEIEDLKIKE